ncbi:unnamed protein product, partial [Rotaria magnacalcarata]
YVALLRSIKSILSLSTQVFMKRCGSVTRTSS